MPGHVASRALRATVGPIAAPSCRFVYEQRARGIPTAVNTTADSDGLSFEKDVKPLFRERDRASMMDVAGFDLWARDDVAEHSQAILERLADGSMPCDQAWPAEQVDVFRQWVAAGTPE
jgi:hypothetical protein